MFWDDLAGQVTALYTRLDREVAAFAAASRLSCPQGCGACCLSETVEATVVEMLPLALELLRTGEGEKLLAELTADTRNRRCILYRQEWTEQGRWGCSPYPHRPVVCRLFGFAGNLDRHGNPRLALCRVMKAAGVDGERLILDNWQSPMVRFATAGLAVRGIHPDLGREALPINEALRRAIEMVELSFRLMDKLSAREGGG